MNNIPYIQLFITIFMVHSNIFSQYNQNYSHPYLYNKNNDHNNPESAQRLTEESYISPEMQWELLSILDQKELTINRITGQVQNIVPISQMIAIIQQKIQNQITAKEKEILKNGLRTMLEATEIAIFVANVEAAHKDSAFIFYQTVNSSLLAQLQNQKQIIETMTKIVNSIQVGEQNSYFSWLWQPSSPNLPENITSTITIPINYQSDFITIPAALMPAIIKNNDYKQKSDPVQAANLLFKECFIAQQHHLKDYDRIEKIRINLQNPISATNYIYDQFPNFYEMCEIAKNIVPDNQYRFDVKSKVTKEQIQAHQLLMHMRQAVQTALYISNRKSSFNLGYLLPNIIKSYLDATLSELLKYDAELSSLSKNPQYGATIQDTYQDEQWSNITKWAIGTVATAVALGTAATVGAPYIAPLAKTGIDTISSWWSPTTQNTTNQHTVENSQANQAENQQSSWYTYLPSLTTVGKAGKVIAVSSGIANQIGAQMQAQGDPLGRQLQEYSQYAGIGGTIAGGLSGQYSDIGATIGTAGRLVDPKGKIGAVSGAIGSSLGAYGATEQAYKTGDSLYVAHALSSALHAKDLIYNAYNAINNSTNQPINNVNVKTVSPQEIYTALIKIIQETVAENGNVFDKLSGFISYLFNNRIANPPLIADMLQKLPGELTANPQVAQAVNQIVQILNDITAQQQKAQNTSVAA